eukprot:6200592-Pleurochrysis_carterae.AAC.1
MQPTSNTRYLHRSAGRDALGGGRLGRFRLVGLYRSCLLRVHAEHGVVAPGLLPCQATAVDAEDTAINHLRDRAKAACRRISARPGMRKRT